ncbi:DUF58 domain-containing protein [Rhodopirellula sp. MGV]|uniref:DUF58 domain-containing protein n=1 Tax=Rhodopirellula sp. MGV TaxID=2023130 RepID=UPI000B95DBD5|nr:DUF58 domain-containing protein [Rhodopirellula sp. MGV]OYP38291.1 hypothetical protein CGZ80_02595 [Rhodopirellula sp. MGV]PNY38882.1 DUF58 domain-containing protein [Rhodopirellula baltica]
MLPREVIRRVRDIQIRTGRQVADVLAGQYESVFKGRGIEFDEVRPYVPGDDVRTIDWNVTARVGEPYVKRYIEDRQLTLMVMADVSASQDFGSNLRSKREATAELSALLAFSANQSDDKIGLTLFHGNIEQYIPARKGGKHSLRVIREVLAHGQVEAKQDAVKTPSRSKRRWLPMFGRRAWWRTGRQATNIAGAMEFLMSVTTRKTICFVISDFLDDDYIKPMQSANRKHDVIAVLVTDPTELEIPAVGLVNLEDAETGEVRQYDTSSSAFRDKVQSHCNQRIDRLRRQFAASGIDFIHIDAGGDVVDPLVKFFHMRQRRMRG